MVKKAGSPGVTPEEAEIVNHDKQPRELGRKRERMGKGPEAERNTKENQCGWEGMFPLFDKRNSRIKGFWISVQKIEVCHDR